jgi:hypothetical protein
METKAKETKGEQGRKKKRENRISRTFFIQGDDATVWIRGGREFMMRAGAATSGREASIYFVKRWTRLARELKKEGLIAPGTAYLGTREEDEKYKERRRFYENEGRDIRIVLTASNSDPTGRAAVNFRGKKVIDIKYYEPSWTDEAEISKRIIRTTGELLDIGVLGQFEG